MCAVFCTASAACAVAGRCVRSLLLLALLGALLALAFALAALVLIAARELLARLPHRRVALVPALHAKQNTASSSSSCIHVLTAQEACRPRLDSQLKRVRRGACLRFSA